MTAAELYLQVHASKTQGYETKPTASEQEEKAGVTHAEIIRRLNLSDADRQRVLDALIDLDVAMAKLSPFSRQGISDFCHWGPRSLSAYDVVFRYGQAKHIESVYRLMNGLEQNTDAARANRRQGIARIA